jgi:hypothetical protein
MRLIFISLLALILTSLTSFGQGLPGLKGGASLSTEATASAPVSLTRVTIEAQFTLGKDPVLANHPVFQALKDKSSLKTVSRTVPLQSATTQIQTRPVYDNNGKVISSETFITAQLTASKDLTQELVNALLELKADTLSEARYTASHEDLVLAQQEALEKALIQASTQITTIFNALQKTTNTKLKLASFYQIKAYPSAQAQPLPYAAEMKSSLTVLSPATETVTAQVEITQAVIAENL